MADPLKTKVFALTAAALISKVAPVDGGDRITVGPTGDITEAVAVDDILTPAENRVLMRLPSRQRSLCTHVDGERIVTNATAGDTGPFTFGLTPVSKVKLWLNFPRDATWGDRSAVATIPAADYTISVGKDSVTLATALEAGDNIIAEYDHTAAATALSELRDIALTLAAVELARRVGFFNDSDGWERFDLWEKSAYADLNRHNEIQAFAELDLVRSMRTDAYYGEVHRLLG
jgi:hypothetical protein